MLDTDEKHATLEIGDTVPNFSISATSDKTICLHDLKGKKVVIYFYPKDSTPGCTIESCGFRDRYEDFQKANTVVLGVSRDSVSSHEKFKAKRDLPFELLSDENETLCKLFDVLKEKSLFGKKYKAVERSTFLIDEKGVLQKVWRKVKIIGHVKAVLDAVKALG